MTKSVALRLCALASLWGSEFLFVKVALRGFSSLEIVAVRLVFATLLLVIIARATGHRFPRDRMLYVHCAVLGLAATVMPYFLMAWSETRVSSALTGILVGAGPLITAAMAALVLPAERLTRTRVAGMIIGLFGVVLVIDPWHADLSGDALGSLAALGVACGFAIGYVYNVRFLTSHHAPGSVIMAIQSAFGALFTGVPVLASGNLDYTSNTGALASVVVLGLFNTGVAAIVFFSLLRDAGAVTASMVEYLMVIVAVVLGMVFLHEHISLVTTCGVALVIGGVAITERRSQPTSSLPE